MRQEHNAQDRQRTKRPLPRVYRTFRERIEDEGQSGFPFYGGRTDAAIQDEMKERDVVRQITDYLAAKHVFAFRLNTGAFQSDGGKAAGDRGQAHVFRFHSLGPGAADIVIPALSSIFLECKAPGGQQSPAQRLFEDRVTGAGFKYLVCHSIDDLEDILE